MKHACPICGHDAVPLTRETKHELRLRLISDPNLAPETKSLWIEWIDDQPLNYEDRCT